MHNVIVQVIVKVQGGATLTPPDLAPQQVRAIMTSCWHVDTQQRMSMKQVRSELEKISTSDDVTHNYLEVLE